MRVKGEINSRPLQTAVDRLASVFKRHVVSIDHDRIEDPAIALALHMTDDLNSVELIELLVFFQELIDFGLQDVASNSASA